MTALLAHGIHLAAASQSTVFVTVGNSGAAYGYNTSGYGSVSPNSFKGLTFAYILNQANGFFVGVNHAGSPLSQSDFHHVIVASTGGLRSFSTSVLGSTGTFTANSGGRSEWRWDGTGIDTLPWGASDLTDVWAVGFLR